MGITVSGGGFGGLIFSLSVNKMLSDLEDQKWALRMICFVTFFTGMIVFVLVEPNKSYVEYYESHKKRLLKASIASIFDKNVFKSFHMGLLSLWYSISLLGYTLMLFTVSPYAKLVGLSSQQGAVLTALLNSGQLIGRPFLGYLGDKFGRCNVTIIINLFVAILLFAFWINADNYASLIAFALLLGAVIGIGIVMGQPLTADLIEDPNKIPAAWSTVNIVALFFCLVAEVIALSIRNEASHRPYLPTQIFSGSCFIASFVILLIVREFLIRRRLKIKKDSKFYYDGLRSETSIIQASVEISNRNKIEPQSEFDSHEDILNTTVICYFRRMFYPRKV